MRGDSVFNDGDIVPGTQYRVIRRIGAGGMGSVYEVEHGALGKRFVLKALLRQLANRDDLVRRLRNEWRALGKLEHPNIVNVTDAGVTEVGIPFYVMERLQGETLGARLKREGKLSVADSIDIATQVLAGLSAAHAINVVHRDIKPPNIFLCEPAPGAEVPLVKVLDFGIAKITDPKVSAITGQGVTLGTPRYMAPEQAGGEAVDARTDLYAVGLILFEMIAGTGPFDKIRDANELFLALLTKPPPRLATLVADVPPALDRLVASLLAKKAVDRPATAQAVAHDLKDMARGLLGRHSRPSFPAAGASPETSPGGSFDTLERAQTVPSDRVVQSGDTLIIGEPSPRAAASDADADTHTSTEPMNTPAQLAGAANGNTERTLRIEELAEPEASPNQEAATRTAVSTAGHPETPPPVESDSDPRRSIPGAPPSNTGRWIAVAAIAVVALAAGIVVIGSRQSAESSAETRATAAARGANTAVPASATSDPAPEPEPADEPARAAAVAPAPPIEDEPPQPAPKVTPQPVAKPVPAPPKPVALQPRTTAPAPTAPSAAAKKSVSSAPTRVESAAERARDPAESQRPLPRAGIEEPPASSAPKPVLRMPASGL